MEKSVIDRFDGEYSFLSNFHPSAVVHDGILYPTVEHAYQAAKTLDFKRRWEISQLSQAGQAKRAGRTVVLREDWERCKVNIMQELVLQKFALHIPLRRKLIATCPAKLVEGNNWGDTFWGVCHGRGRNVLGEILMHIRENLGA